MNFYGFLGFVTGLLSGIAIVWIRGIKARNSGSIESDEMTRAVSQVAAQYSFYATAAFAFIVWVADNTTRHLHGEAIQMLSPWGIMVFVMMYLILIFQTVVYYKQTGAFVDTGSPSRQKIETGIMCIAASAVMFVGLESSMRELMVVLLPIGIGALLLGLVFLYSARKKS